MLHCTTFHCTAMQYTPLHHTELHCTAIDYNSLHLGEGTAPCTTPLGRWFFLSPRARLRPDSLSLRSSAPTASRRLTDSSSSSSEPAFIKSFSYSDLAVSPSASPFLRTSSLLDTSLCSASLTPSSSSSLSAGTEASVPKLHSGASSSSSSSSSSSLTMRSAPPLLSFSSPRLP